MMADWLSEFELDHVGIAVSSLSEGRKLYDALGFQSMAEEVVASEKVKVGMFKLGNKCQIELLEPMGEESPIAKFLSKRGPGIHHICLRVKDLRQTLLRLKKENVRLINEEPRPGAHGCQVAFIHPSSTGGVLIELSQPPGESP